MRKQEHKVGIAWHPVKFQILLQFFEILNCILCFSDPTTKQYPSQNYSMLTGSLLVDSPLFLYRCSVAESQAERLSSFFCVLGNHR